MPLSFLAGMGILKTFRAQAPKKKPRFATGPGHGRSLRSNAMHNQSYLITNARAQEILSCSRTTLHRLCKSGHIRPVKLGRAVRFQLDEIEHLAKYGTAPAIAA